MSFQHVRLNDILKMSFQHSNGVHFSSLKSYLKSGFTFQNLSKMKILLFKILPLYRF